MALSLVDFQNRPKTVRDWIIPNFLARQNTAFIMGQPKKAVKSWLMLDAGWGLSEGLAVWGLDKMTPLREMRTVYFAQEDTEDDIDDRIQAHMKWRKPNDRLWVVPKNLNIKLDTPTGRNIVQKELDMVREKAGAIDLVMFDPMRRIHNGNENDSETIAEMWDVIDRIHKRYDCGTIISHHTVKPPREKDGWDPTDPYTGRGSGDIYGGGDAFVVVVPGKGDRLGRQVTAHFESKRGSQMEPAGLKVEFGSGRVTYMGVGGGGVVAGEGTVNLI